MEWDDQRTKAMAEEDWHGLLDLAQHFFLALYIPFRLACLLGHLLAMCHTPTSSKTLLEKVLVASQKKSLKTTCQQIRDFSMELEVPCYVPPSTSTMQVKGFWVYAMPPNLDKSSQASRDLKQDKIYNNR